MSKKNTPKYRFPDLRSINPTTIHAKFARIPTGGDGPTSPAAIRGDAAKEIQQVYGKKYGKTANMTVDDDIAHERAAQINKEAGAVLNFMKSIGDADHMTLWKGMDQNIPDIKKYHEWHQNKDGSFNIDWLDLQGKSNQKLKWYYHYWKDIAVGSNKVNKERENDLNNSLYHDNKLTALDMVTNPHMKSDYHYQADKKEAHEFNQALRNFTKDSKSHNYMDSWLSKIHWAQFQAKFYEQHIDNWIHDRHKYQRDINRAVKKRDSWLKTAQTYINQKNAALNHANIYLRALQQRHQQEIDSQIQQQVKANDEKHLTSIYCADRKDPTVIGVSELSPNEEMSMDLPTQPIDSQMPEGDYANVSELQLSGTYYVFVDPSVGYTGGYAEDTSPSYRNRVHQYNVLRQWAAKNKRVVVKGFTWWSSTSIQTISRDMDANGAGNSLQLGITFQYQRVAKIATAKQKAPTGRRKGRARKNGRHSNHAYKVRRGDSIYKIAHGNMKQVKAIEKANPSIKSHPNLIYTGNKLVIPQ